MASIEIFDSRLDAMSCVDLSMYPVSPAGKFFTKIEDVVLPRYGEGILAGKFVRNDITLRFKTMTCDDICGIQTTAIIEPFVVAKACSHVISQRQIQAFAAMIIGPRKLQTPFDFFLEAVFGSERPNEFNGSVFIDTPPTVDAVATSHHFFSDWGGTVVFSNEPVTILF